AARAEAARSTKLDRSQYETVRSLEQLKSWIERAAVTGLAAIRIETTSFDPMQSALVGIALAVQPNEACYVPLTHRQPGGDDALFRRDPLPDQVPVEAALDALRPLLEDHSILNIGYHLKFSWLVFSSHDVDITPIGDGQS